MIINNKDIIGEVVAKDFRAASVFKSHQIDFCCNGNRTVEDACEKAKIDSDILISELNQLANQNDSSNEDFRSWDMDLLADYIEKKHHRYVEKSIPEIKAFLNKLSHRHGPNHPELIKIEELFLASSNELTTHMKKEELVLFPFIRKMASNAVNEKPHFGKVENPIEMMMEEHSNEGERFRIISELSNNYLPPVDACTTYRVTFAMLKEFEEDLHKHIHLENNILFPKAIEAEKQLDYA